MNKNKKKTVWIIIGVLAVLLLSGAGFFFTYYRVTDVQVMGTTHYNEDEVKQMALQGAFMNNSVLASGIFSQVKAEGIPFIDGFSITSLNRHTICISVKEKQIVGCIPYLGNYVYFDRNGIFVESSVKRQEDVPFFDGIQVNRIVMNEKLPIKGSTVLNTAVALASIFQKNDTIPDHIQFDENYRISLLYGDITVNLGKDEYLEDKMMRVLAILPMISGQKGILHMENVTGNSKVVTFEKESETVEITAENWPGGYDENGEYTGDGEYDENGKYVGPRPKTELDYALENWPGGYDEEGDYTGEGEYDADWNYVGPKPTAESIAANGDWHGGYTENGVYTGTGEFDREGNYLGPNPNAASDETEDYSEEDNEESYQEDYEEDYQEDYDSEEDEGDYSDESYEEENWE